MFGLLSIIPSLPACKFRKLSKESIFITSLVTILYAWTIRKVLSECKNDIFMTTGCNPYLRFSAWRKCVQKGFDQITQAERLALNVLGPTLSKLCYTSTFTDSKGVLLMCAISSSYQKFLLNFIYLWALKRFSHGYLSPFLSIALFVAVSIAKWYCIENSISLTSYNFPFHMEFRILESTLLAILSIAGTTLVSKLQKSEETLINLIVNITQELEDATIHN